MNELQHHGIKGQKWGVRRYQNSDGSYTSAGKKRRGYVSLSPRAIKARRANAKIDKSFKEWNKNSDLRAKAIESGKNRNIALIEYERNPNNKEYKQAYKQANKMYKSDLKKNTSYRKGQIRAEVGKDISRKHLSEAKRVQKELNKNPNDIRLAKRYNDLMNTHDIERAKARRAVEVGQRRSVAKAGLKRKARATATTAVAAATLATGVYAFNKIAEKNGLNVRTSSASVVNAINIGKTVMQGMATITKFLY